LSVTGQVKKVSVQQSSGNKRFDNSVKSAIYKAESFQMPNDKELLAEVLSGFLLDFGED
jgi:TonB family protein